MTSFQKKRIAELGLAETPEGDFAGRGSWVYPRTAVLLISLEPDRWSRVKQFARLNQILRINL